MPFLRSSRSFLRLTYLLILGGIGCANDHDSAAEPNAISQQAPSPADKFKTLLDVAGSNENLVSGENQAAFRNVSESLGIQFHRFNDVVPERYFLPEVMGGGVAWFDYDGDGLLDLYATNGCRLWEPGLEPSQHVNRLYSNRGEQFVDVTFPSGSGDAHYGQGCAVGDFNADGFPDLFLANYGRNSLLTGNGDGTFSDVTDSMEVGDESWGTSAVWFDANNDGFADLYVVNYLNLTRSNHQVCTYGGVEGYCGPGQYEGVDDLLYLNSGDGRFQPATAADGIDSKNAKGLAVAVCDFDLDSRPEIYVANDMAPNFLFTRLEEPPSQNVRLYRNVADAAGCAVSSEGRNEASMGIACADFDGNGLVDVFLTHYYQHKNTLYRNLGALLFEDDSRRSRTAATSFETLGFGTVAFDFDQDSDEDLFVANGHVLGPKHKPNEMFPQLLENDGTGVFEDVSRQIGGYFEQRSLGRGVAKGDYDNDGRADLAVTHLDQPLAILRNESDSPHHFIGLELIPKDRIYPSGGRVTVVAGQRLRVIPIIGGGSYLSTSDPRILVGLGNYDGPVKITVNWPNRHADHYARLSSNGYWILREGERELRSPVTRIPQ